MDTIKQLFNRPAEAIIEKFNQKKLGTVNMSQRESVYKINNSITNEFSKDYSIEISKNNVVPSPDIPYLEMILLKQPQQRKLKELEFVKDCLKQLEIFQSWHENQSMQSSECTTIEQQLEEEYQNLLIYKYINYRSYCKYECIFTQDEPSKECYTIFKGQAIVLQKAHQKKDCKSEIQILQILQQFDISREEYDRITELFPHQMITGKISKQNFHILLIITFQMEKQKKQKNTCKITLFSCKFNIKIKLEEGRLFGEIELYFKEPRVMTIVSITENTSVGYFDLKSFKLTLQAQVNRQKDMLLEFFKNVQLFKGAQESYLKILVSKSEVVKKPIKTFLYKQNDLIDYVYFILSGEVELTHMINDLKIGKLSKSRDHSTDKAIKSFDKSYNQQKNIDTDDFYDEEKDIIADVKEAIQLNMFYKPQKLVIQNNQKNFDNQIQKHLKQLQYLAEEKQYNYINAKNNTKSSISTILGSFELFGDQLEDYDKRNNTAKVISSSVRLVRIKSSVFFDIVVNSFSKLYPQIDIIKSLQIKNKQFQKHKEQKIIPRKYILDMIQSQQKVVIHNDLYKKYEAEVSTTSLQSVLEKIYQQKKLSSQNKKNKNEDEQNIQNDLSQQDAIHNVTQKNFRTRVLSNYNQYDSSDQDSLNPISPASTIYTTSRISQDEIKEYKNNQISQKLTGGDTKSSNKTYNNQRDHPSSFTPIDITFNKNVIRGSSSSSKRGSLSSFSSAYNHTFNQTSNLNINQQSFKVIHQEAHNNLLNSNSINGLSTPNSTKNLQRPYSRSNQFFSQSATNKDSIKFDFSSPQAKKERSQIPFSPQSNHNNSNTIYLDDNLNNFHSSNEVFNSPNLLEKGNFVQTNANDKNDYTNSNNNSVEFKQNGIGRSRSSPHSSSNSGNGNAIETNHQQKLNQVQLLSQKNSIFDILYPSIVNKVNRQIGVLKTSQQLQYTDPKIVQFRKPCINTLQFNTNKEKDLNNQSTSCEQKIKLKQNKTLGRFFTPQKAQIIAEKTLKVNQGLDPMIQQQEQDKQKQLQEEVSQQMYITYKHLKLDKMFPKSEHAKRTKKYFQESANDFKAKINFDKMQIKIKNQQVSYLEQIEQKFLLTPQKASEMQKEQEKEKEKDTFNFIQKNNS